MNDQQLQQSQTPPPNYLAWAIISTILCCLPFGIVSIIYAAQVNSKWASGDVSGAQQSSKNAKHGHGFHLPPVCSELYFG